MNLNPLNITDGIIVINKPAGLSSARIVSIIKKTLNVKKAGHTGTLDPFATGVMICGINKGTKLSRFLLHDRKKYIARVHLGIETDTLDLTGEITEQTNISDINPELFSSRISAVVNGFQGVQMQIPPVYSALKHNGIPLYKYARMGNPVTKPPREITIYSIRILDISLPYIDIEVDCSAGTYIRVLASDIGAKLGCGAHLATLERVECCGFDISMSYSPEELSSMDEPRSVMINMSDAIPYMKKYIAGEALLEKISFGREIYSEELEGENPAFNNPECEYIKITDQNDSLKAIITRSQNKINYCCVFHT